MAHKLGLNGLLTEMVLSMEIVYYKGHNNKNNSYSYNLYSVPINITYLVWTTHEPCEKQHHNMNYKLQEI